MHSYPSHSIQHIIPKNGVMVGSVSNGFNSTLVPNPKRERKYVDCESGDNWGNGLDDGGGRGSVTIYICKVLEKWIWMRVIFRIYITVVVVACRREWHVHVKVVDTWKREWYQIYTWLREWHISSI